MPPVATRVPDHPRIRGEHLQGAADVAAQEGIIPAYAGSTQDPTEPSQENIGSSPHTRGAPQDARHGREFERIIPAYAGSTHNVRGPGAASRDHPRIRGEHFTIEWEVKPGRGSSPHTRGAPGIPQIVP